MIHQSFIKSENALNFKRAEGIPIYNTFSHIALNAYSIDVVKKRLSEMDNLGYIEK